MAATRKCDVIGQRFGRLVVEDYKGKMGRDRFRAICKCDCGETKEVDVYLLQRGNTRSCGCLRRERAAEQQKSHGLRCRPEYDAWNTMWQRCVNPKNSSYSNYGGRGITVCNEWSSFEKFYEDMGPRPEKHSLDRKNNYLGYFKANCRWATQKQQVRNMRTNIRVEYEGSDMCLAEVSERSGVPYNLLYRRVKDGWNIERAASLPRRGE